MASIPRSRLKARWVAAPATAMRNQNGVVIEMTSTTVGLDLTLAAQGVKVALARPVGALGQRVVGQGQHHLARQ